jgi:hypothetical protein
MRLRPLYSVSDQVSAAGVRCYRQSLHTNAIETQKLGKTICDVPTGESI